MKIGGSADLAATRPNAKGIPMKRVETGGRLLSRRDFLHRATAWTAGGASVIAATALGRDGRPAPSERIVMGCIGSGDRGQVNIRALIGAPEVQFVAVCDVDAAVRQKAKSLVDKHYGNDDCKAYNDFRELLDRGDITAVDVSTPDHWHAIPTIEACRRGIDVHVEKPLSLTIRQGRAMVEAARRYGCVVQTGSEARASRNCRFACELVRNGRIGQVKEIYVGGVGGPSIADILPAEPVPPQLDWDLWLGPRRGDRTTSDTTHSNGGRSAISPAAG